MGPPSTAVPPLAGHSPPAAIALAWAISHDPVVVIPGASTISQLEANAAAAGITLAPDEQQALTAAASQALPPPGQAQPRAAAEQTRHTG